MFLYNSKYSDLTQEVTVENVINITINAAQNCIPTFNVKFDEEDSNEYIQCAITYILDNYDRFIGYYNKYTVNNKLSIITYITRIIKCNRYVFYYQTIYNYSFKEAWNYQRRYFENRTGHKYLDLVPLDDCYNIKQDNYNMESNFIANELLQQMKADVYKLPYREKSKAIILDYINNNFSVAGLPQKYNVTRQWASELVKRFRKLIAEKYLIE